MAMSPELFMAMNSDFKHLQQPDDDDTGMLNAHSLWLRRRKEIQLAICIMLGCAFMVWLTSHTADVYFITPAATEARYDALQVQQPNVRTRAVHLDNDKRLGTVDLDHGIVTPDYLAYLHARAVRWMHKQADLGIATCGATAMYFFVPLRIIWVMGQEHHAHMFVNPTILSAPIDADTNIDLRADRPVAYPKINRIKESTAMCKEPAQNKVERTRRSSIYISYWTYDRDVNQLVEKRTILTREQGAECAQLLIDLLDGHRWSCEYITQPVDRASPSP